MTMAVDDVGWGVREDDDDDEEEEDGGAIREEFAAANATTTTTTRYAEWTFSVVMHDTYRVPTRTSIAPTSTGGE